MSERELMAFLDTDFPEADGFIRVEAVTDDGLIAVSSPGAKDLRPGGTVSGPTLFALADVGVYLAILSRIGPKALTVTTNATIDFMRKPDADRDLKVEVRLLKLGKALAVADALIFSEGRPGAVARASMTYSIPPASRY